jgi:hypothetical protein
MQQYALSKYVRIHSPSAALDDSLEVEVEVASPQPPPRRAPPIASRAGPSFNSLQRST